jgi:hypothetical protein
MTGVTGADRDPSTVSTTAVNLRAITPDPSAICSARHIYSGHPAPTSLHLHLKGSN